LIGGQNRFVIRLAHDRKLQGAGRLIAALDGATVVGVREVALSARVGHSAPSTRKIHPPRERHVAKLAVSAMQVVLQDPQNKDSSLALNIVQVTELDAGRLRTH
jgi:hypothetical protein